MGLPPRCRAYGFTTHIVQGSLKPLFSLFRLPTQWSGDGSSPKHI
ncbi:hypothetical protein [Kingella oralis]|nr:hypothetical protein [Kingella oralis]